MSYWDLKLIFQSCRLVHWCSVCAACILLLWMGSRDAPAQSNYFSVDYDHKPGELWGPATKGLQMSLALNFQNIPYATSQMQANGVGKPVIVSAPPNTTPLLTVLVLIRNTSNNIVYLLGDKTRSGTDPAAFVRVAYENTATEKKYLNLHPAPFERQDCMPLASGETSLLLEQIPYETFMRLAKDASIMAAASISYTKPLKHQVVKPDVTIWSNSVVPPWDQMGLYFDQNK